uniref:Vezatin n=1 Tax=Clastoptera arizonana TaxID=38151 RepID=A0A1B6CEJ6_9HEMI
MEDDGDVVVKGSQLHRYLESQGLKDYELVNSNLNVKEDVSIVRPDDELFDSHNINQIKTILESTLLFTEDASLVNLLKSGMTPRKSSFLNKLRELKYCIITAILIITVSSCIHFFPEWGNEIYIMEAILLFILGLILGYSILKKYSLAFWERKLCNQINSLCFISKTSLRLLCFLRETEVMSSVKNSSPNFCRDPFFLNRLIKRNPEELESWITLPELRKFLIQEVLDLACSILESSRSIKKYIPSYLEVRMSKRGTLNDIEEEHLFVDMDQNCIPLHDIQKGYELFLLTISEYLRNLAFILYGNPSFVFLCYVYKSTITKNQNLVDYTYKSMHSKLRMFTTTMNENFKVCQPPSRNELKTEFHNISLQLLSYLSQVRDYERSIEDMTEDVLYTHVYNGHQEMLVNFDTTFLDIKQRIITTQKICKTALKLNNTCVCDDKKESTSTKPNVSDLEKTTVHIGLNNYEVKTDSVDVFLGRSEEGPPEETNSNLDDFNYKLDEKIRSNVMKELSEVLRSRKKEYEIKENIALEKKGLLDNKSLEDKEIELTNPRISESETSPPELNEFNDINHEPLSPDYSHLSSVEVKDLEDLNRRACKKIPPPPKFNELIGLNPGTSLPCSAAPSIQSSLCDQIVKTSREWGLIQKEDIFCDDDSLSDDKSEVNSDWEDENN